MMPLNFCNKPFGHILLGFFHKFNYVSQFGGVGEGGQRGGILDVVFGRLSTFFGFSLPKSFTIMFLNSCNKPFGHICLIFFCECYYVGQLEVGGCVWFVVLVVCVLVFILGC